MAPEAKFAFLEFRTIAECTSCIALNNIELGGKQLRIERPRDYAPMPDALLDELRNAKLLGQHPHPSTATPSTPHQHSSLLALTPTLALAPTLFQATPPSRQTAPTSSRPPHRPPPRPASPPAASRCPPAC